MKTTSKSIRTIIYGIVTIAVIAAFLNIEKTWFDQEEAEVLTETENVTEPSKDNFNMNLQLRFTANQGQAGEDAKYHVEGAGHTVLFYKDKVEFRKMVSATQKNEIVLQFEDANQNPIIEGVDKLRGVANFFKGSDQSKWQTNVPTYASVLYKELYPGIDMAYIGVKGDLESEFYVLPGADYHQIELDYSGIISKKIRDDGALVLETALGELVENTPIAFQEINGNRHDVDVQYALLDNENIGFELGNYNSDFAVVIDPLLMFGRVVEGAGAGGEYAEDVAVDSEGNIIIVGSANSSFPVTDEIEGSNHEGGSGSDGIIIKADGNTGEVMSSALYGGSQGDNFRAIAIDASDNIYLTGITWSNDFPVVNAAQESKAGDDDAFMVIFNAALIIQVSTYLGGTGRDWGEEIAIDGEGSVYVAGRTNSMDFTVFNGFQMQYGGGSNGGFPSDAFITKYMHTGEVDYSTYLGGSNDERIAGIEVTGKGRVAVAGGTLSEDFFTTENAFQETFGGAHWGIGDIFVSLLNNIGNQMIYSTYLGGAKGDWATGIALDNNGNAVISGGTMSSDFNGESGPDTNVSDGIIGRLNLQFGDDFGDVTTSRTNIPGNDRLVGVEANENGEIIALGNTFGDTESYEYYGLDENNDFEKLFGTESTGFNWESLFIIGEHDIVLGGTYWDPDLPSGGKIALSLMQLISVGAEPLAFSVGFIFGGQSEGLNKGISDLNAIGSIDVYFDSLLAADNVDLNSIQLSPHILRSQNILIEITESDAPDNSNPLATFTLDLREELEGGSFNLYDQNAFIFYEVDDGIFNSLLKKELRTEGSDPTKVEIFIAHTAGDALGMVDLQLVDNSNPPNVLQTLFDDIPTESVTDYVSFDPAEVTFQITNADNSQQYGLYSYDLSSYTGQALVGTIVPDSLDIMVRELLLFDTLGNQIESIVTAIVENIPGTANAYELSSNYPNPFSSSTIIYYSLPESSQVSLRIYNAAGQEIVTLVNELQQAGSYEVTFNANDLPGGIYFYSITANDFVSVKKMMVR